jgi:glutaredoxin-like protein NrdH
LTPEITFTVYTRTVCQPCIATKRKLKKHGFTFDERNVEQDPTAAQFLRDAGYTEAPVVIASDGQEWTGFRPDLIQAYADAKAAAEA